MCATFDQSSPNPLAAPELVSRIISFVDAPIDLLHCSCVNWVWSMSALEKLYRGSMNDMRYLTPDIGSLNSLFVASRERFARNMRFVKYLTIASTKPAISDFDPDENRPVCIEKCRPLRDRESAELLLRPRGKGATSLAIPFELVEQDLSHLCDLILHPDLKFLTIDHIYCMLLNFESGSLQEHSNPLSNLAALSIHRSDQELEIEKLCEWLSLCDLKLFQINEFRQRRNLSQPGTVQLLRGLWRHRNLETLALRIRCCETGSGKICADLEDEMGTTCWPRLKALYLTAVDHYWLEKLPTFGKLRILELRNFTSLRSSMVKNVVQSISRCQYLQVVDVEFPKVDDPEIFLTLAKGCPILRRFSVRGFYPGQEMTGDQFSRLLLALPQVEFLSLNIRLRMAALQLRDLANSCPRLIILEMTNTRLHLSLKSLEEAPPFSSLKEMSLESVWFDEPDRYAELSSLKCVAREWNRVFPRIRRLPCPADRYSPDVNLEANPSSREPDGDGDSWSTENDSEMSLDSPGLLSDDYSSNSFYMRRRLWKLLGYIASDGLPGISHIWQTNFEIKTIGWPVVPMRVFLDPQTYSMAETG